MCCRFSSHSPVCLLLDRFELTDFSDFSWLKPLRRAYPRSRLDNLSPSYASVFSGTLFENYYVDSDDYEFLQPVTLWALQWKYGGMVMLPTTILLQSLR